MIRVAIVEDETIYARQLEQYLQQYADKRGLSVHITSFEDGLAIVESYRPEWDLIFLDIRMAHMDGMETAKRIRDQDSSVILIFITSMAQYAIRGYEVDAQDFILKPVSYPQLSLRLDKAVRFLRRDTQKYLILPFEARKEKVAVSDILYIEVQNHNVHVVTPIRTYLLRGTLQEMEEQLAGCHFSRCNHCYLVNLQNVTSFLKDSVIVGNHELAMSRPKKKQFMQDLSDYLGAEL